MSFKVRSVAAAAVLVLACTAAPASAEIVHLTSGRTLSVKQHRLEGDSIVLTLRSGGEVTCDRTLVERIVPDEVPYEEPAAAPVAQTPMLRQITSGRVLERTPYGEIIARVSQAHGVDPLLVRALIQVESNYRPRAKSHKGAMGLMQLMPSTAREYKLRNPYDPTANIEAGIKYLKSLIDRYGGVPHALAAYNAGPAAVQKFKGIPPYRETRNYVAKILSLAAGR
jgi:Transglycosylase SLT domain